MFVAGAVVQWLRDGLGIIQRSSDVEALAASVPDADGVYLVPAFVGLGAPYWDPYARGTLAGLTRKTPNPAGGTIVKDARTGEPTGVLKSAAVALVRRSGRSANQVAQELGVSQTVLSRWLREAVREASPERTGSPPQRHSRPSAGRWNGSGWERDILKKAAAFFANESR